VAVIHGYDAVMSKHPDERGDLEPLSREEIENLWIEPADVHYRTEQQHPLRETEIIQRTIDI